MIRALLPVALLGLPGAAFGQSLSLDLGAGGAGATARLVQLTALIGLLSLAPALLVMLTAFARIVIVLALLRTAIGAPAVPPNPVLIALALFLTLFVMEPALLAAWEGGISPMSEGRIGEVEGLVAAAEPFRRFMAAQVREADLALFLTVFVMQPVFEQAWTAGILPMSEGRLGEMEGLAAAAEPFRKFMAANVRESDLNLFLDLARLPAAVPEQAPYRALMPAFLVTELKRAFEIGFLLFLPFLVIDMVVASILMSLGMMMLPPSVVALPSKLIFFVLIDGWALLSSSLVQGFAGG